jgi:hypothetical protein
VWKRDGKREHLLHDCNVRVNKTAREGARGEKSTRSMVSRRFGHRLAGAAIRLYQHAVAVGIEAIMLGNCVAIGAQHIFFSAQRANQHEQRGLGQMKVGEQSLDYSEFVSGVDEQIGLTRSGLDVASLLGGVFQSTDRGCAYGYDSAGLGSRAANPFGSLFRNRVGFRMKFVFFDLLNTHGLKSSQSDVQSDFCCLDTALVQAGENFRREVKTRGRGGN